MEPVENPDLLQVSVFLDLAFGWRFIADILLL